MIDYESYVQEQENRKLFDKPIRFITYLCHPHKMDYEQFLLFLKGMELQDNLRDGETFIEEWFQLFLAYYEIEQSNKYEERYNAVQIDANYENSLRIREV